MGALDWMMRTVEPTLVEGSTPTLQRMGRGIWQVEHHLDFMMGLGMPCRMTILEIGDGSLMVHAPVGPPADAGDALGELGEVAAIVAPNSFHHVFVSEWARHYPSAGVYAAPGLFERGVELPEAIELGDVPPPRWADAIEQVTIRGGDSYTEVLFHHRRSNSLIVTDLAFPGIPPGPWWSRAIWRAYGMPLSFGPSRVVRWTLLAGDRSVREGLREVLNWEFRRICLCHGPPVEDDARTEFRRAFAEHL